MRLAWLFTVPQGEKVTEKHLRRVLISSVISMLLCMTCLVTTTWAWFTTTITSEGNVIEVGSCEISVTVIETATTDVVAAKSVNTYALEANKQYQIAVVNGGTAKGFCKFVFQFDDLSEMKFCTNTLSKSGADANALVFTIHVQDACTLMLDGTLGNAPADAIVDGDTVVLKMIQQPTIGAVANESN